MKACNTLIASKINNINKNSVSRDIHDARYAWKDSVANGPLKEDQSQLIEVISCRDEQREFQCVVEIINNLKSNGLSPRDIAVLYRMNVTGTEFRSYVKKNHPDIGISMKRSDKSTSDESEKYYVLDEVARTLTHSPSYSLTHSLAHLLTHSLTYLLTYSLTHSLTHSLTYSLTHSLTYSLTHSLTHLLTHSPTHSPG